jgi:hypothetical protein
MHICEEHCRKAEADHWGEEKANIAQKSSCLRAVIGLRNTWLIDLQLGKQRLKYAGAWIK